MNPDELVDVVDERGNFIKVIAKKEAHSLGLLHKTVISVVLDTKGRYLLVQPKAGRQDALQYVNPIGGHVAHGETDLEAMKREGSEELGLPLDQEYELLGMAVFNRFVIGRQENHLFIIYKTISDQEPILDYEHEDLGHKYFTEEELKIALKQNPDLFGEAFHIVNKLFFPQLY